MLLRDDFDLLYSLHLINMGVSLFIYPKDLASIGVYLESIHISKGFGSSGVLSPPLLFSCLQFL